MQIKKMLFICSILIVGLACGVGEAEKERVCQSNMRTISSQEVIYNAQHDFYADDLSTLDLDGMECPSCEKEYEITADSDSYYIVCPCGHGNIYNGVASWTIER